MGEGNAEIVQKRKYMSPTSHFAMSWLISNSISFNVRERFLITLSGVLSDIDGMGVIIDLMARNSRTPTYLWDNYHHTLCHNIGFGLLLTMAVFALARVHRVKAALLAFICFHLHLLCDLIGSKGPEGYQWPIPYFKPFSDNLQLVWAHQWELNAWPNILIGTILAGLIILMARYKKRSPFELISKKMDTVFINMVGKK